MALSFRRSDRHSLPSHDGECVPATCREMDRYTAELQMGLSRAYAMLEVNNQLMAGAFQFVLNLGDFLRNQLFGDDLSGLKLTSDQTAVKYEGASYSVVLRPFGQKNQIELVPAEGLGLPFTVKVTVVDGQLSESAQTHLLGGLQRIRAIAAGSADPVTDITLVDPAAGVTNLAELTHGQVG